MLKTVKRILSPLVVVLLMTACVRDDPTLDSPSPTPSSELSVSIESPSAGDRVTGNVVTLEVAAEGLEITEPDGDISGETGHFHVFVDRDSVATGETISDDPGVLHFAANSVRVPGLGIGPHKLTVVLGDGSETRIGRTSDSVEIEVAGPSIDASAPESAPLATGFQLATSVSGVEAGDAETGNHLDLVIDPDSEPEAAGQPIPADANNVHTSATTHQVTGLPAGEHTIWVIVTDQNHVPLSPMVADRVLVTIR